MQAGTVRTMRMLMLTDTFSPCPQSSSQRLSSFAQFLREKGYNVTVVAANRCIKGRKVLLDEGFLKYDLKYPLLLLSGSSVIASPMLFFLYFFISGVHILNKKVDVILASVPNAEVAIAGFLLSKIFRIPLVIDMRDLYPPPLTGLQFLRVRLPVVLNRIFIRFSLFLLQNSDRITCVDADIKRKLLEYGVSSKRILVIPNGADTEIYFPCNSEDRILRRLKYGFPPDKFVFVYAGSLVSYYPIIEAIKGLNKVCAKPKDVQLLVVSYMNYTHHQKIVEKSKLEDVVKFLGPLSVAETAEVLSVCDVGIVTYRGEAYWSSMYGGKIFSYMSCGLPILASGPHGSVVEGLIRKFEIGFFIGEPSEGNFAKGYDYFLNNKLRAMGMGAKARKIVETFYDARKLGLKFASLVDELCDE